MNIKDILFKEVQCTSFLKKVYDGKFMLVNENDMEVTYCDSNNEKFEVVSECCGDLDFLKTYFEIKDRIFSGVVVGIKNIVLSGYLAADTNYESYSYLEHLTLSKHPHKVIECAIVYYRNNRKSYVPLDSIKVGD